MNKRLDLKPIKEALKLSLEGRGDMIFIEDCVGNLITEVENLRKENEQWRIDFKSMQQKLAKAEKEAGWH